MRIKTIFKGQEVTLDCDTADFRSAFDYAIRHNQDAWDEIRDIAGRYQAELMAEELKRRKFFVRKPKMKS